jgi:penicillin-binding protein 1B
MTLRQALARSDNVAAVKVAEGVGLNAVVDMARRAGLNDAIKATPAVALGAYNATPLEMAAAYTPFANGGVWVKPTMIAGMYDEAGAYLGADAEETRQALPPALAWLMTNMMEEVMRTGTAAGVRARGFTLPAAGKTGTSHDGWFAGFTSQLLCVVWVGFDDYSELGLEGAKSALPIWTEFMKRATHVAAYRNAREFPMPSGIEQASICVDDGMLASGGCTNVRNEYFIAGSTPQQTSPADPVVAVSYEAPGRANGTATDGSASGTAGTQPISDQSAQPNSTTIVIDKVRQNQAPAPPPAPDRSPDQLPDR